MTRIKICGITNYPDARRAVELGADALGFVFAPSPRRVSIKTAGQIIRRLPPFIWTVGVFQNQPISYIKRVAQQTRITAVQLHGEETPSFCQRLGLTVIKTIIIKPGLKLNELSSLLQQYQTAGFLLDAGSGSGRTFDWNIIRQTVRPVIIAGGLQPDNIGRLIQQYRPYAVDVSSGVESSPGRKDHDKLRRFFAAVRKEAR